MGKILKMSPHLANMIAAGEVVERPSSVVKELVENAIDAKASSIKIYLKNGGLEEIRVSDDGEGMDRDDVLMAFIPHATSKIKSEYDLFRILTLGFRGEAIASIAAVSEMNITSSQDGIEGYSVTYKAGIKKEEGITHSNKGTTVTVSGLFFNTPARLKYMRNGKKELSSILYFIDRIAMAHPDLRFTVFSDDKIVFQTSGSDNPKTLIAELYGMDAARCVMETSFVKDGYKAHFVVVKPQIYRSTKLEITIICNGRFVKNYNMTEATISAFSTYLPIGKYPIVILYFELDPLLVDVNVHPNKTEVKIANEEEICNSIKEEISKLLYEKPHIPTRNISINEAYQKTSIFDSTIGDLDINESFQSIPEAKREIDKKPIIKPEEIKLEEEVIQYNPVKEEAKKAEETPIQPVIEEPKKRLPYMEYVGSVFGTYLIFQNSEGMYLMDQHAAAERINYEKYYEILGSDNQPTCELLLPISISFTKSEAIFVENNIADFEKIGFTLEPIGELDYSIRRVPVWAKIDNLEDIIYDILSKMIEGNKVDVIYFRDHIAKMIACKASIKANHQISKMEVDYLVSKLNECKNPYTCPHGRPTIIRMSVKELEEMFERIQK
ncbi:DNA mismatch repair protein MutL [Anaeroplasma bactoclasticum]|jgi:DNA mismatch repair protein MutL|uniref:DNA mismatch repair protein MutL n=1 Tax=Anaeroplasma bactoclasticum TaxID=2088 RepID=A0A397RZE1_9MOLU|nr:DNA mismatch repair endonuclease MutL [Anaeroplasma bactoclasticum]RIA77769.1 DNA mismatch repair protein MutL [Anaeroplasma bactoclasticum]